MNKKINKILFGLLIVFLGVINVNAASLRFDGSNIVEHGSMINQNIILATNDNEIVEVKFDVVVSNSGHALIGITKDSGVGGEANIPSSTLIGTPVSDGKIATLNISNNNSTGTSQSVIITLKNITFKTVDGNIITGKDYDKIINLSAEKTTTTRRRSNNPYIGVLSLSVGDLTPKFESGILEYKVFGIKDTIKTITINHDCDHCDLSIKCELGCEISNNKYRPNLEIGKNIIKITSTSESGSDSVDYLLTIYRGETTDNSAFLQAINIDEFKLYEKFDKKNLDYTVTVPNEISTINIDAVPEDPAAKVEIKGNDDLIVGDNVITITITSSETKDVNIYNITVTRLEEGEIMPTTTKAPIIEKEVEEDKDKTLMIVLIALGALILIAISAYFIFFRKKRKDKKPELITDEGEIEKLNETTEISLQENELMDELNIKDEKVKPTVDDALADLMTTKELLLNEE